MLARISSVAAVALVALAATPRLEVPMVWNVDGAHTEINFTVKHFFTPVTGSFEDFDVDLVFDSEDVSNSHVSVKIAVASVNTGNEKRNKHLQSADFFDAESHPYITFESDDFRPTSDGSFVAVGDLTIKGVSRRIELPIELLGVQPIPEDMRDMLGGVTEIVSFDATMRIDRGDFGVGTGSWAATLIVGGNVDISIALEANRS
jgi:polyisoprenoid-binding protein YceI